MRDKMKEGGRYTKGRKSKRQEGMIHGRKGGYNNGREDTRMEGRIQGWKGGRRWTLGRKGTSTHKTGT
jgi:hypothetical protein